MRPDASRFDRISLPPEWQVILCLARSRPDSGGMDRALALLRGPLNWRLLRETASRHGVLPLIAHHLAETLSDAVPEREREWAAQTAAAAAARGARAWAELQDLAGGLAARGVPVIALKGPVFAAAVYGDISLKSYADLDLLVRQPDAAPARRLFASLGYKPQFHLNPTQEQAFIRFRGEEKFFHFEGRRPLDLHWRLSRTTHALLDDREIWERASEMALEGRVYRTLSPEDTVLFLCSHGAQHGWGRLIHVCDIAEFLRAHPALDWSRMTRRCAKGGCRALAAGLMLARDLYGVSAPESAPVPIFREATVPLAADARDRLIAGDRETRPDSLRARLAWVDRPGARLACLADALFSPSGADCGKASFPPALFFVYYLVRIGRLLLKYTRRYSSRNK